jgi:hypothetical protein
MRRRVPPQTLYVGDFGGDIWRLEGEEWKMISGMPKKYEGSHDTACGNDSFIVTVGREGGVPKNAVFKYSANSDTWTTLPFFKYPRSSDSSVCFKGCVYVIRGWEAFNKPVRSVEKFDFRVTAMDGC